MDKLKELLEWLQEKEDQAKKDAVKSMVGWSASDMTHTHDGKKLAFQEVIKKVDELLERVC